MMSVRGFRRQRAWQLVFGSGAMDEVSFDLALWPSLV